ncbi:acyl carrier protein [Geomonas sp. Red32]|uniref:acyl carrier protein n=1 Tax=Geomonas sp. Red32 TaxID=2912856 RepID=UPI00202CFB5F|nr:acyl carrier protein [Geomonas sp. Red32]MCM0082103.1 acyl carrier protein [Geomonas sp. Red32]
MSLKEEIRNYIVENFLFGEEAGLKDDSSFIKEGIVDSTGIMQLVSYIQEQYRISVEDEELTPENLDSIRRVTTFVEDKLRSSPGAP